MLLVQVPITVQPVQVDDFPEGCERSVKGSLRLRPSSTLEMTKGEYDHLCGKKHRMALGSKLHVVKWSATEDYDTDKSTLGKKAKIEREKTTAAAPKRAKDNPTARQRKDVEREAKAKGDTTPKPSMAPPPPSSVEPETSGKQDKPKGKSKNK